MKVIFFILENLGESGGGAERFTINLCNELSKTNPNIFIISLTNKGNFYKNYIDKKVNLIILPYKKSIYSIYSLQNLIKKKSPNIVFSSSFHVTVYSIIIKLFLLKNFFIISRISNNIKQYFNTNKNFKFFILYYLYFNLSKHVDLFVCPSNGLVNELKSFIDRKYHKKILLINNPVDIDYVKKQSKLYNFKKNIIKKIFFLNIGRLVLNKDHVTLIKAFKYFLSIKKDNKNYELIIIGDGVLLKEIKFLIKNENLKDKVKILRNIKNPYQYINKSRIFILSSLFEGYPNVLLEAQVLAKKIISTDCKHGPREILENGKYGYLVKIRNYKKLGLTMYKALNNENKSISLTKLKQRNSLKLILSKYLNLFESLYEK